MEYVRIYNKIAFKCEDENDHEITIPTISSLSQSEDNSDQDNDVKNDHSHDHIKIDSKTKTLLLNKQ